MYLKKEFWLPFEKLSFLKYGIFKKWYKTSFFQITLGWANGFKKIKIQFYVIEFDLNLIWFNSIGFVCSPECGIAQLSLQLFVLSSWSTSITSNICLFKLVHLTDLLLDELVDNVVKEVNIKDYIKLSIKVFQKAAAPKNGVEFCQGSIGAIRSSLATSYAVWRRCATLLYFNQSET